MTELEQGANSFLAREPIGRLLLKLCPQLIGREIRMMKHLEVRV
jgi:hypothetical protein